MVYDSSIDGLHYFFTVSSLIALHVHTCGNCFFNLMCLLIQNHDYVFGNSGKVSFIVAEYFLHVKNLQNLYDEDFEWQFGTFCDPLHIPEIGWCHQHFVFWEPEEQKPEEGVSKTKLRNGNAKI